MASAKEKAKNTHTWCNSVTKGREKPQPLINDR